MTTNPLHRDEREGTDSKGRLHGASAVQRLLNATETGPEWRGGLPVNLWEAADDAVGQADTETKDAALRRLLALHMHDLTYTHPQIAMRNIRVGDVVEMAGAPRRVIEKIGDGKDGTTVQIRAVYDRDPDAQPLLYGYEGDVHVSLLHRVSAEQGQRLFMQIVELSERIQYTPPEAGQDALYAARNAMAEAFVALTGESEERLWEEVAEALQARGEECAASLEW